MERFDIFKDIAERTNGNIYIGVVGPVRSGKSTFIKKFMEIMVIPHIKNSYDRERAKDELPQSGAGRTVMTTEPKFIPNEAIDIKIKDNISFKTRIVDCVGYTVEGALGYDEEDGPRMVQTPWYDYPIPFQEAAELGTKKVISDHSTIGLVITTDGSITEIPRNNYISAEERIIAELKELKKPFAVVLNSTNPESKSTNELALELRKKYDVPVIPANCSELSQEDIFAILEEVLYEFPVREINFNLPRWVDELPTDHWLRQEYTEAIGKAISDVHRLRDINVAMELLKDCSRIDSIKLNNMDLGNGIATIGISVSDDVYFEVLSEIAGIKVEGKHALIGIITEMALAKREYDKIADALEKVYSTGYGIVAPKFDELKLEEPEIIRQGNKFGVKLKASAPSIHMIKADIVTEVSPIVGSERQSEELMRHLLERFEEDPTKIWELEFFGRSFHDILREGIQTKLSRMPETSQQKLRETLQRIVNEGSGGLICIIL
ncbi:MAG TPA: stage IV sporulation protein A [Clostridia bacterium]|nr:stage IV sporulation protein A [Clostridia bacterium]